MGTSRTYASRTASALYHHRVPPADLTLYGLSAERYRTVHHSTQYCTAKEKYETRRHDSRDYHRIADGTHSVYIRPNPQAPNTQTHSPASLKCPLAPVP